MEGDVVKVIDAWLSRRKAHIRFDGRFEVEDVTYYVVIPYEYDGRIPLFVDVYISDKASVLNLPPPSLDDVSALALELEYGAKLAELLEAMAVKGGLEERLALVLGKVKELYGVGLWLKRIELGEPSVSVRLTSMRLDELGVSRDLSFLSDAVKEVVEKGSFEKYGRGMMFAVTRASDDKERLRLSVETGWTRKLTNFLLKYRDPPKHVDALRRIVSLSFLDGEYKGSVGFMNRLIEAGFDQPLVRVLGSALEAALDFVDESQSFYARAGATDEMPFYLSVGIL